MLVATAVAFPGQPQMVLARFLGSLLTSIAVGLVWWRVGGDAWVERARAPGRRRGDGPRWLTFSSAARHDLWDAGGWLVVGAAAAATLQVLVPRSLLLAVADHPALSVLALGGLAVLLAICSEADAFVAASLREFSLTARLVFLVVGPAVDVKLIAMQSGMFGRQFAARFAPLTFVVAVVCALVVGRVLLMTDEQTRSVLLVVLGATAVWLWWSGEALNYVRPGLAPLLLAGGVVVLLLGLLPPLGLLGEQAAGHADGHGGHRHRARVGWLLLVPVLVVMLVQPAALGSYAVSSRSVVPGGGDGGFPPLAAPVRGAVPMSMAEFVTRAVRDPGQSLAGVRVRLVGFVAPGEGDRRLPADPLRHLLLRRRRRSPPGGRARRPDPAGPGPVAGGRGNLGAPPGRRRRPEPAPARARCRRGAAGRPAPPAV